MAKFMSCYFLAHRSKTFVHTLKKSLKGVLPVKSVICQRRLHVTGDFVQTFKSFESCFARQDHNLPTTITCHRRLVPLMAERQKKPRLLHPAPFFGEWIYYEWFFGVSCDRQNNFHKYNNPRYHSNLSSIFP